MSKVGEVVNSAPYSPNDPEQAAPAPLYITTDGGAAIMGNVDTKGDFVGRDKNNIFITLPRLPRWFIRAVLITLLLLTLSTLGVLSVLTIATFFQSAPPALTDGAFNIYVAEFGVVSGDGQQHSTTEARSLTIGVARMLADQAAMLKPVIGEIVQVWGVDRLAPIVPFGEEEAYLKTLQAPDMLVYGVLVEEANGTQWLQPKFYVADQAFGQATELAGEHALGTAIRVRKGMAGTGELNATLQTRVATLMKMVNGLSHLSYSEQADYEKAGKIFQDLTQESPWAQADDQSGEEILYLFLGNAYLLQSYLIDDANPERNNLLANAHAAFLAAQHRNPTYARAYNGLGAALFQMARPLTTDPDECAWSWPKLEEATQNYRAALSAPNSAKPPSGFVDLRATFGLGRIHFWQGYCLDGAQWEAAETAYTAVLSAYSQLHEPAMNLTSLAALAHTDLGHMAYYQGMALLHEEPAQAAAAHVFLQKALTHYAQVLVLAAPKRSFVLIGAWLSSCLLLLLLPLGALHPAQVQAATLAQATTTPNGVATPRRVGWVNRRSPYTPARLHHTATTGHGALEQVPALLPVCPNDDTTLMAYTPTDAAVLQDEQERAYGAIYVRICQESAEVQFVYLVDPRGRTLTPGGFWDEVDHYFYQFSFDAQSPDGIYELHLITNNGDTVQPFVVGPLPGVALIDPVTQAATTQLTTPPGRALQVRYTGLLPGDHLEVGLYRQAEDDGTLEITATLIDSWQLAPGVAGSYTELLELPPSTPPGDYFLGMAVLDRYAPSAGELPSVHLVVTDPAVGGYTIDLNATVDPVAASDGLRLRVSPHGAIQYTMPANRSLLRQPGAVTTADGVEWYQVQDQVTGRSGWVMARYVILGSAAERYVNLHWRPGCAPDEPVVELLRAAEQACTSAVATLDLASLTSELQGNGLLRHDEWLVPVPVDGRANLAIRIQRPDNNRVSWLQMGTAIPGRTTRSPFGAVWRTGYLTATPVGPICWLRTDDEWYCE